MFLVATFSLTAQESPAPDANSKDSQFSMGLTAALGAETIDKTSYQYLSLLPDFGYGPWGLGIDLSLHFEFNRNGEFGFYPRSKDWYDPEASAGVNIDKYLARLAYIRYGHKGDPLYAQLGWLPSTTLGTGFVVSGYNNGALRPNTRLTGLILDASGSLISVPWIGWESFVGNLSTLDLVGARIYAKPLGLIYPEDPILKNTQLGFTVVADTNPYVRSAVSGSGQVVVLDIDALAPLYSSEVFTTRATVDLTAEGTRTGAAFGLGGSLVRFVSWGFQIRALGENFIPNYFDQGYELSRVSKYLVNKGIRNIPGGFGYLTSLGTSVLGDALVLNLSFSGPFGSPTEVLAQPQLIGTAQLKTGLLPFDFNAFYVKQGITSPQKLLSAEDALIGAKVGYTYGVVTLSVVYDLHYDNQIVVGNRWVTTSRIETAVKLF